jgi:RNA polymerase sporulation-specific sigma factor
VLNLSIVLLRPILFLISYISDNNSFPKPLSPKDEQLYFEKYKQGDIKARNKLIEHNLRLVAHISKKYIQSVKDSEDLISIGTIGLMKGIESFDPSKSSKISTYVSRCIENEILMLIRQNKKMLNDTSLEETVGIDKEGNEFTLFSIMSTDDNEIFESIILNDQIKSLYEKIKSELDEREIKVLKFRYGLCCSKKLTQREIARKLGISRSYVSRIEKKAIMKLKKKIFKEYLEKTEKDF